MGEALLVGTLCFFLRGNKVLLARKKRKIGVGLWNGYGGTLNSDETPEEAAVREVEEECGVEVSSGSLEKVAVVDFHNRRADGTRFLFRVHIFLIKNWIGSPQETEEMGEPHWFPANRLPLPEMMLADRVWLPLALRGGGIFAEVYYGPSQQMLDKEVLIRQEAIQ